MPIKASLVWLTIDGAKSESRLGEPTNQIAPSNFKQSDWSPLEPGLKISFLNDLRNIEPKYVKFSLPEPF